MSLPLGIRDPRAGEFSCSHLEIALLGN